MEVSVQMVNKFLLEAFLDLWECHRMTEDQAQVLAMNALGWMASQDDVLEQFLGASGTDIATLKVSAGQAETQIAILDFLMMRDDWIQSFCSQENLPYEAPMQARHSLPGGADTHWT